MSSWIAALSSTIRTPASPRGTIITTVHSSDNCESGQAIYKIGTCRFGESVLRYVGYQLFHEDREIIGVAALDGHDVGARGIEACISTHHDHDRRGPARAKFSHERRARAIR